MSQDKQPFDNIEQNPENLPLRAEIAYDTFVYDPRNIKPKKFYTPIKIEDEKNFEQKIQEKEEKLKDFKFQEFIPR